MPYTNPHQLSLFNQARYTRKPSRGRRSAGHAPLVRATVRDTTVALGARWFNITYSSRCKHYAVHDVTYEPNLNRPAVKLTELTRASGSTPPDRHVGPPEAIKRDWGRRQTSLL